MSRVVVGARVDGLTAAALRSLWISRLGRATWEGRRLAASPRTSSPRPPGRGRR